MISPGPTANGGGGACKQGVCRGEGEVALIGRFEGAVGWDRGCERIIRVWALRFGN